MATSAVDAINAIKEAKGFVSSAAKRLGISRTQLHRLINSHPTIKEALDDAREEMKDFAEGQLFMNIRDGKETSLIFFLKTQAKDRGYVERQLDPGSSEDKPQFNVEITLEEWKAKQEKAEQQAQKTIADFEGGENE